MGEIPVFNPARVSSISRRKMGISRWRWKLRSRKPAAIRKSDWNNGVIQALAS